MASAFGLLEGIGVGLEASPVSSASASARVDRRRRSVELVEPGRDGGDEIVAVGQGQHAGQPVQRGVDLGERRRRRPPGRRSRDTARSSPASSSSRVRHRSGRLAG